MAKSRRLDRGSSFVLADHVELATQKIDDTQSSVKIGEAEHTPERG